jgi:uncharacterized metal-binding protein YceD (DUF177 family)
MKYTISQLRKLNLPLYEESEFDFSNDLNGFEDILSSSKAAVKETLSKLDDNLYHLNAHIKIDLVLESSITLKKVPYAIDTILDVDYTTQDVTDEDAILVENGTIDTTDAILTEILCQKPMTVRNQGEEFESDSVEEAKDDVNPAFAGLADLLK